MSTEEQIKIDPTVPLTAEEEEEAAIDRFEAIEDANPGTYRLRQNLIDFAYEEYASRVVSGRAHGGNRNIKLNRRAATSDARDKLKYNRAVRDKANGFLSHKYHSFVIDFNTLLTTLAGEAIAAADDVTVPDQKE